MSGTAEGEPLSIPTVQALSGAEDIGDEEVRASNRWFREFVFATQGITEGDRKTAGKRPTLILR